MNALVGLDSVDWTAYSHAYGGAGDVPDMLRRLLDAADWDSAANDLWASILHQGTIYTATIPAMGFLAEIAADASVPGRAGALGLLTSYAESIRDGWTTNKLYLPKKTNMKAFDRDARAALAAAIPVVLSGLSDTDPEHRAGVAVFLERVEELPEPAVAALRAQWRREDTPNVLAVLTSALNAHGGIGEDVTDASDVVRFTAAWSAIAAGTGTAADIDTVVDLWADHASWLEKSGVTDDAVSGLLGADAAPVDTLVNTFSRIARTSRRAVGDGVRGLGTLLHYRRDAFRPCVEALIELAESVDTLTDIDLPYNVIRTAREHLVFGLVNAKPGLADSFASSESPLLVASLSIGSATPSPQSSSETDLLNALARVAASAPAPTHGQTPPSEARTVFDRSGDARADALPTLMERPIEDVDEPARGHWLDLLRAVLADSSAADRTCDPARQHSIGSATRASSLASIECARWAPTMFGRSPLIATIADRLKTVVLPIEQARQLADLAAAELGRGCDFPMSMQWFGLLGALPDEATKHVQPAVLEALRAVPHTFTIMLGEQPQSRPSPLVRAVGPTLLRWKVSGTEELLDEWARESWPQASWAQLVLGVLTDDQHLIDEATADGLPETWGADFIALASDGPTRLRRAPARSREAEPIEGVDEPSEDHRSSGLTAACQALMTGKPAGSNPACDAQIHAARIVAEADGISAVWPTLIAIIDAQGDPLEDALAAALSLLETFGPAPASRDALTKTLVSAVEAGPRTRWDGKDYQSPVRAAGALLDLGEPMPELSVKHSLALLRQLTKRFDRSTFDAVPEACRLLSALAPDLPPARRKRTLTALAKLLDSPFRVGFGNTMIAQDTSFTSQLKALVER